ALVQVLDEAGDAVVVLEALRFELTGLRIGRALVGQRDLDALVEEGELTQTLCERVVVVLGGGKDGAVGEKVNLRSAALGWTHFAELADGLALGVVLLPGEIVAPDL